MQPHSKHVLSLKPPAVQIQMPDGSFNRFSPSPPLDRMTKYDVKNYLEKIYDVPVGAIRTRIQFGEYIVLIYVLLCFVKP